MRSSWATLPSAAALNQQQPARRPLHDVPSNGSNGQAGSTFSRPKQTATFAPAAQAAAPAAASPGQYSFPGPSPAAALQRRVVVPTSFGSAQQYLKTMQDAAAEEVSLRLADLARAFHAATAPLRCRPPDGKAVRPEQPPSKDIERACHRAQLQYYRWDACIHARLCMLPRIACGTQP